MTRLVPSVIGSVPEHFHIRSRLGAESAEQVSEWLGGTGAKRSGGLQALWLPGLSV